MFSQQILLLLLSIFTTSLADPICIAAILSTVAYSPALIAHNKACPTGTPGAYDLAPAPNQAGCCPSSLRLSTVGVSGVACCPCAAQCTGYFPDMLEWSETGNQLVITPAATVNPTIVTTTPQPTAGGTSSSKQYSNGTITATASSSVSGGGSSKSGSTPTPTLATATPVPGTGGAGSLFGEFRGYCMVIMLTLVFMTVGWFC